MLVLSGIVLAALAWLLSRPAPVSEIPVAARPAARMADLQLPGGVKVSVPEGSFNFSLHQWLSGTTDTSVTMRFVFDNLNFETASTQLTPESVPTVESLVVILKAYPAVVVRLEGHTDSTGDAVANKKLSLDRAIVVKEIIVKGGIPDGRVATDGYGQEKPIAPNETEDGRAKNRRTELVVEKR
jgi:outer membrane protein OmpA-like peptidoglycan-associated protein